MKKIFIASDHGGFQLKKHLLQELPATVSGIQLVDLGPSDEKSVDYPDQAQTLCEKLLSEKSQNPQVQGILVCGSGQGMAMKANRYKGIRAALCWDLPSAMLSRQHNDANVLCIGGRLIPFGYATEITKTWLQTPFEGGRHEIRVSKLDS